MPAPIPAPLTPKALARLLARLALDGSSGRLTLTGTDGADFVALSLDGGRIGDIAGNGTLPDASAMPLRLRTAGLASKDDLEETRVIAERHGLDRPVTAVAIGRGIADASSVQVLARALVVDVLACVAARWSGGTMDFEAGIPTDGLGVLVELGDPEGGIRTALAGMLETSARIPSLSAIIKFKKGGEGAQQIGLEPTDWAVLTLVDNTSTLAALARACGLTDAEALRVACHLLDADLLVVESPRKAGPASSGLAEALAALGAPDIDEPAADEPAAEEPAAEEPAAEEPAAEEPAAEEPAAEEPAADEPAADEPAAEEPAAEEPAAEEALTDELLAEEPVAEEPVAEEPVAEEPVAYEPAVEGRDLCELEVPEPAADPRSLADDPTVVSLDEAEQVFEESEDESFDIDDLVDALEVGEDGSHVLPEISELPEIGDEARLPRAPRVAWPSGRGWDEGGLEESLAELGLDDETLDDPGADEQWWSEALADEATGSVKAEDDSVELEVPAEADDVEVPGGLADAGSAQPERIQAVAHEGALPEPAEASGPEPTDLNPVEVLAVEEPGGPADEIPEVAEPGALENSLAELALWDDDVPEDAEPAAWFPELDDESGTEVVMAEAGHQIDSEESGSDVALSASPGPGTEGEADAIRLAEGLAELSAELESRSLDDAAEPEVVFLSELQHEDGADEEPAGDGGEQAQADLADLWTSLGIDEDDAETALQTAEADQSPSDEEMVARGTDAHDPQQSPSSPGGARSASGGVDGAGSADGVPDDLTAVTYLEPPDEAPTAPRPRANWAAESGRPEAAREHGAVEGDRSSIARAFADLAKPLSDPEEDRPAPSRRRKAAEAPAAAKPPPAPAGERKLVDPSVDKASLIREFSGLGFGDDHDDVPYFGDASRPKPSADDKGHRGWFGKRKR